MAKIDEIIEGLTILKKYVADPDKCFLSADHDIIYGPDYSEVIGMSDEDRARLKELGWHLDEDADCWAHYT